MLFCGKRCYKVDCEVLGYQISAILDYPPLLFATIRDYSRLFATICPIRDYSYYSYTSHYSLFGTIQFSFFGSDINVSSVILSYGT